MTEAAKRFSKRGWGVFNHYLYAEICSPKTTKNLDMNITDWNEAVNKFDVERLAYKLHKMGVGYYFITLMQGTKHMLAPNATYDRIAGTKPGEACATRDLPMELADALAKYDIDLCLYYTGDGPHKDEVIGNRFGFIGSGRYEDGLTVDKPFVENWAGVLEEYAVRYGDKVKAWWIDGCYKDNFGYTDELLDIYYNAIKKGNPNGLVAFNDGVKPYFQMGYYNEDFVCGEFNDFLHVPANNQWEGALVHTLAPLGYDKESCSEWGGWGSNGLKHTKEYMRDFIRASRKVECPVTVDIWVNIDGSFDPEQEAALMWVGENL